MTAARLMGPGRQLSADPAGSVRCFVARKLTRNGFFVTDLLNYGSSVEETTLTFCSRDVRIWAGELLGPCTQDPVLVIVCDGLAQQEAYVEVFGAHLATIEQDLPHFSSAVWGSLYVH